MISAGDIASLVEEAARSRECAYAPYSSFKVGAALLAESGSVFRGCNVENASYGLTMCAERVAIGCAVAAGERRFRAIAIVAGEGPPVPPCGACRQIMVEFCPSMAVVMAGVNGEYRTCRADELLPDRFGLGDV